MLRRQETGRATALRILRHAAFWLPAAAIFAGDRFTKNFVLDNMRPGQSVPIVSGILHVTLVENPGGAFGLLPGGQIFFTSVAIVVLAVVVIYQLRGSGMGIISSLALGLILGGTVGNLFDRLSYGKVVDWIDFRVWPVFNIADSAVVFGIFLLSLTLLSSSGSDASNG